MSFYWKDTQAGTPTLTAATSGFTSAIQSQTVNAATASQLVFTSAAQTQIAGACALITNLQTQDQYGNPSNPAVSRSSIAIIGSRRRPRSGRG